MEAAAPGRWLLAAVAPAPETVADPPLGGPASPVLDVLLCLLPVAFLLVVTLSQRLFLPTARSLPWAAFMMWSIKMCWIGENPIRITATVMQGALLALTPLSILFSAFVFFNSLTTTNTLAYMAALVRALCRNHPVAEVMLVLWAFGHLIEGAAGFGTGPAMLPPIMAALGHAPFESVVCLLIMTTCVGPFGSSGIGLWFGLSALDWSRAQLVHVTFLVAVCMAIMSFPICWLGARFLLTWRDVRGCWLFCLLSVTACALPTLLASLFSFEAPGLLSGVLGMLFTGLLARKQLGLSQQVPCVLARRLHDLEGGAAAPQAAAQPGHAGTHGGNSRGGGGYSASAAAHQGALPPMLPLAPPSLTAAVRIASTTGEDKPLPAGARPLIELTAVACAGPAAPAALDSSAALAWPAADADSCAVADAQRQRQGPRRSVEEGTVAARGLLAALAASASPADGQGERRRSSSAQAVLEPCSSGNLCDDEGDGDGQLLPARAVRSHHSLALPPYRPLPGGLQAGSLCLPQAPPSGPSAGPTAAAVAAAASGSAGACPPEDAGTAAYLADRRQLAARLAPWGCMLAVVAGTRASYLQHSNGHELTLHLRSLGDLTISSNLVISFHDLCRIGVNWSYALLYVPALLPFICTACATLLAFRHSIPAEKSWKDPFRAATAKCKSVAPAIIGALILVALMVQGGRQAPSYIIGYWLSEWLGRGYIAVSQLLGAVGSFFSGSVATSNMTFGLLQQVAAKKLGLNATAMVMLQIVGGAAGQMISISNILGGRAVMGLQHVPEGRFVKAALPACLAYYVAGTLLALPFLFS
ncbi:hypothetical protein ABPG75_005741 [Micractinium tetrahymenae]